MSLNELWFILIAVLFSGFFFLEGFDFGVGILTPILGKSDSERRMIINTIGPVWDANEVWLLTAGGAIFAAFPGWYATMFSGFYLALFLVLAALIVRGVAFEFRSKVENPKWRNTWDIALCIGSFLPPVLFGVAMANLIKGLPIDKNLEFVGNFFDLLSIPTVVVGLTALALFLYHGSIYLQLKLEGLLVDRAYNTAKTTGLAAAVLALLTAVCAAFSTDIFTKPLSAILAVLAFVSLLGSYFMALKKKPGIAMILNSVTVIASVLALFSGMFPNVMVSSLDPSFSLTITNASSTPYTLKVMTIVTLTVLPVVLLYSIWTYRVFRKRVTARDLEY